MKILMLILAGGILLLLMRKSQRVEEARTLGWRVGHVGRDGMYYEERVEGEWQRIAIDGEMLGGPAHHVIYFPSADAWQVYPAWARDRRAEIVARIKSKFGPPDYEHHGA